MPHAIKAFAVLLNWRRGGNLFRIIDSLSKVPQVAGIVIWNNAPRLSVDDLILCDILRKAPGHWKPISVYGDGKNHCIYGRYQAMEEYGRGDVVLVQDDDYVVLNWQEIIAVWAQNREKVVTCLYPWHMQRDGLKRWHGSDGSLIAHEVLLGWGSAFDWRMAKEAFRPYLAEHGKSQVFLREADRIFTIGLQREHIVLHHQTLGLHGETDHYSAMYLEPNHMASIIQARTEALQLLGMKYEHKGL